MSVSECGCPSNVDAPGKKLLFMGGEIGQRREWHHDRSLDWHLLGEGYYHRGLQRLVRDLNRLYRRERALHELDADPAGFAPSCNARLFVYGETMLSGGTTDQ